MAIRALYGQARLFELADDDPEVEAAFLAMHDAPDNRAAAQIFAADSSLRVALAAKLVIEQSDFIIAVWDGERTSLVGGTGHTVAAALETGAPVIWIDAAAPGRLLVLSTCWPFDAKTPGPERFLVHAERVGEHGPGETPPRVAADG